MKDIEPNGYGNSDMGSRKRDHRGCLYIGLPHRPTFRDVVTYNNKLTEEIRLRCMYEGMRGTAKREKANQ